MFDTMTMTKIVGGFCGAFLVFLLGNWAASELYSTGGGHEGAEQAYVIETGGGESADAAPVEEVDFATVLAAADPAAGEKAFSKCKACHKLDGADGTGPHLNGVVGRAKGGVGGFGYSATIAGMGGDWTPEDLSHFLENPKAFAPGTKMSFAGMPKVTDRANLIAYLATTN